MRRIKRHMHIHGIRADEVNLMMTGWSNGRMIPSEDAWELDYRLFNNFFIRCLLGFETFYLPLGGITQAHQVSFSIVFCRSSLTSSARHRPIRCLSIKYGRLPSPHEQLVYKLVAALGNYGYKLTPLSNTIKHQRHAIVDIVGP